MVKKRLVASEIKERAELGVRILGFSPECPLSFELRALGKPLCTLSSSYCRSSLGRRVGLPVPVLGETVKQTDACVSASTMCVLSHRPHLTPSLRLSEALP